MPKLDKSLYVKGMKLTLAGGPVAFAGQPVVHGSPLRKPPPAPDLKEIERRLDAAKAKLDEIARRAGKGMPLGAWERASWDYS